MLNTLKTGQWLEGFFLLRRKELRKKDNDECYLHLELGDASGRISGSCWQNVQELYQLLQEGAPVKVRGQVIEYKGRRHLSIEKVRPAQSDDVFDIESLTIKPPIAVERYWQEILSHIQTIKNPFLQRLMTAIFHQPQTTERFCQAPAGKLWHHDYIGGLAQHTCQVANICRRLADLYPQLNKDLLLCGALLHDIGKMFEFEDKGFIEYSDQGRLLGHITIGCQFVAKQIDAQKDFPDDLRQELLHLILSHQGAYEQGSPVLPMTREAMLLHFADQIDSQLNAMDKIFQRESQPGKRWSSYVKLLERYLYLGGQKQGSD